MTRDGAALENKATGDMERISKRDPTPVFFAAAAGRANPVRAVLKPPLSLIQGAEKQETGTAERVLDRLEIEHSRPFG